MRRLFYVLDSGGYFTNLQLYALGQARKSWDELHREYVKTSGHPEQLEERCVFAVCALGLSISQLLGQNNPKPQTSRVPSPKELFGIVVEEHDLDRSLVPRFDKLIQYYDACRHFGLTLDESKYEVVAQLDFETTKECFETGLDIWRQVLNAYGREPGNDLRALDPDNFPPGDEEVIYLRPKHADGDQP